MSSSTWFARIKAFAISVSSRHDFWPCALTLFFGAAAVYLHGANLRMLESIANDTGRIEKELRGAHLRMLESVARDASHIEMCVTYLYKKELYAELLAHESDAEPWAGDAAGL